jgi:WD40 repeat protein
MRYIDDVRIMAVSNSSQVIVVDSTVDGDPVNAFWMADKPWRCKKTIVDYNDYTFQLMASPGREAMAIYDVNQERKVSAVQTGASDIVAMSWLKYFSTLYYIVQEDLSIFDARTNQIVRRFPNVGRGFVGGNVSSYRPDIFVMGSPDGTVSLWNLPSQSVMESKKYRKGIKLFDVHRHLPIAVGIADALVAFSFEEEGLVQHVQNIGSTPLSFAFHQSEPRCAIRTATQLHCVELTSDKR